MRRLLWGRGISALGDGLWFTIWAVYFTRIRDMPPATVGAVMAVAAACGLAAAVPLGSLADRRSPRTVLVAITAARAAAMAAYLLGGGLAPFFATTVVFVALANGGSAVRTALVAALVRDNETRVRALAQQRVAQHVGYAAGAGLGALVLTADQPWAYRSAIAANAVTFVALAVITATIRPPSSMSSIGPRTAGARSALRDVPYVSVVGMTAILSLCWAMLSTGLPLWISRNTSLPLALSGAVVVISSIGIAALQVPATRFARTPRAAARTTVAAAAALAASCALLATTGGGAGVLAAALVIAAAVLHVAGEIGYVAAGWGLSVGLMREEARGAYQGVAEAATAGVQIAGPAVFTLALGGLGATGWLVIGAVFLTAAAPVPALARWAERTRPVLYSAASGACSGARSAVCSGAHSGAASGAHSAVCSGAGSALSPGAHSAARPVSREDEDGARISLATEAKVPSADRSGATGRDPTVDA